MTELKYRRVLLKLSGEALMGDRGFGIDPKVVDRLAGEIVEAHRLGIQVGVVVGGGNIFRGVSVAADGGDRTTGDYLGMLGTVMNALAMRTAIERLGAPAVVLSAIAIPALCETFTQREALRHFAANKVIVFAAGTGNPFFTTDSGAAAACRRDGLRRLAQGDAGGRRLHGRSQKGSHGAPLRTPDTSGGFVQKPTGNGTRRRLRLPATTRFR